MTNKNLATSISTTAGLADSWVDYDAATCTAVTRLGWSVAGLGLVAFAAAFILPASTGFGGLVAATDMAPDPLNSIAAIGGAFAYLAGIALLGIAWTLRGDFGHD